MKYIAPTITRLNPTINGNAHLGHLYCALVNAAEANRGRGRFLLKFDDTHANWAALFNWEARARFKRQWIDDLEWAGLPPDLIISESEMEVEARDRMVLLCHHAHIPVPEIYVGECPFPDLTYTPVGQYPYQEYLTAMKVVTDMMLGVTMLIRGQDLLGEFSLYSYFGDKFGNYMPRQVYIPRLTFGNTGDEISKTSSVMQIHDIRKNTKSADVVIDMLRQACLKDKRGGFTIDNIVDNPVIEQGRG